MPRLLPLYYYKRAEKLYIQSLKEGKSKYWVWKEVNKQLRGMDTSLPPLSWPTLRLWTFEWNAKFREITESNLVSKISDGPSSDQD